MSLRPARSFRLFAVVLGAAVSLLGCKAKFPIGYEAGVTPPGPVNQRFGDVATCLPPNPSLPPPGCPGTSCPTNVVGPNEPDGQSVDLAGCTLDLAFTRGSIITPEPIADGGAPGLPDLIFHLGSKVGGSARIEASPDGTAGSYVVIGFIGQPLGIDPRCIAPCAERNCTPGAETCSNGKVCPASGFCFAASCSAGQRAVLDLSAAPGSSGCNSIANVSFLRLSQYSPGSISIDAVEALDRAFRPGAR